MPGSSVEVFLPSLAEDLRDYFYNGFSQIIGHEVSKFYVAHGTPVIHECCNNNGIGNIQITSFKPTLADLATSPTGRNCGGIWTIDINIEVWRCVATLEDSGMSPDYNLQNDEAIFFLTDAEIMRDLISCLESGDVFNKKLDDWQPLDAQGGCAGGRTSVRFGVTYCGCGNGC